MKKKIARIFAMTVLTIVPIAVQADDSALATADNGFGFQLLQELNREQPNANIFISSYSAATVLQMVASGAAGQTKQEMQQVLKTTDIPDALLDSANKDAGDFFNSQNPDQLLLSVNNAIWYRQGFTLKPDFLAANRNYFEATVDPLDFSQAKKAEAVINQWAEDKTHGRIKHIADGLVNPNNTKLVLANAVYFKGKWVHPFKEHSTREQPFYLVNGGQLNVSMMNATETLAYDETPDYQAVRFPYMGGDFSMYVFLPATNSSLEKLTQSVNGKQWTNIQSGFKDEQGHLALPKFKFDYDAKKLGDILQAMGMKTAFSDAADFSGMSDQKLSISAVRQKAFVDVNEQGTEAAAVTAVGMFAQAIMMPQPNHFEMIVNRPFLFMIADDHTGIILFSGLVYQPASE